MIVKEFNFGEAFVRVYPSRKLLGEQAACDAAFQIKRLLQTRGELNIMFAAAPSQNEILDYLVENSEIDWQRINAFHMDEYTGIQPDHPAGFVKYLNEHLFKKASFKSVNCINCAANADEEAKRYADILSHVHIDLCILGIGENGHIAFNDPGVADFQDPSLVKVVRLDDICRQQQVNDGCFESLKQVPENAVTVTVPELLSAEYLFCVVPSKTKANAVKRMLTEPVSVNCPASILSTHRNVIIYLDVDSAKYIL